MSENVWLFLVGQAVTLIGGGIIAHGVLLRSIASNSERIAKIEGFIDGLGKDYAQRLHHTDDRYGIDALLDKYIDAHYELSVSDWVELHDACVRVLQRIDVTDFEVNGYTFLKNICIHKVGTVIAARDLLTKEGRA